MTPGVETQLVAAAIALPAVAVVRRRRALLALAASVLAAQAAASLALRFHGGLDPRAVYDPEGRALLHGVLPHSPYPVGAVALFGLESLLGGSAHNANALLMIPFGVLAIAVVRERHWVAAALLLWPANAFFWQFRFDLVPAATIAAGIALARRGRWHAAGWALGAGAAVKWTPALTALALFAWLLSQRRAREAVRHATGAAGAVLLANAPAFALAFAAAASPYRAQSARGITGESLPYLPLRALGIARTPRHYYGPAGVPGWANTAAVLLQLALVAALVVAAARASGIDVALARAALVPAAFLLANRIFSPQFFVVILVCCACALRRRVALPAALLAIGSTANAVLFPGLAGAASATWAPVSALALLPTATAVAVLAW